ncbi:MAG: ABC transporter ATP-binding protein [Planctomycetes bacterium]|nr:ABC transporter ATP-binding protein [Planctomycetota bacterium]MCB9903844.1 ABC transporter ATP-binding protein [Planctomycetota bacterium]
MWREYAPLWPFLRRYFGSTALGALCILLSVGLKVWIPLLIGDALEAFEQWNPAEGRDALVDGALQSALLIAGTALVVALVRTASRVLILGNSRRVAADVREHVFDHLLRLAPSFFLRNPAGQVMSRVINDLRVVQSLVGPVILYIAENLALFAFCLVVMLRSDPLVTVLALAPYPFAFFQARRLALRIQLGSAAAQNALGDLSTKVDESLSGQQVIKTMALEESDMAQFEARARHYRDLNLDVTKQRAKLVPLMLGLTSLSTLIVLGLGGLRVANGQTGLGPWTAMLMYLGILAGPTRTLGFVISTLRRGAASLQRLFEITASEVEIVGPPAERRVDFTPGELVVSSLSVVHPPISEQPHLEGSMPVGLDPELADRERAVLRDVSFRLAPGETLGVVGHTGSGKTTLARVLARQWPVARGVVSIGGTDINDVAPSDWRRRVGFVPQEAFLFSRTLAANVALGRPEALREEVEHAVRISQLANDLDQLPEGLDTVVGERGVNLSGGQRQRAALARVFLLDRELVILDDTLSAVDTHTADRILEALEEFLAGKTTVIVSHRLSAVKHADEIIVLEEGAVAERGTHLELLARGGIYAELWEKQERHEAECDELGIEITSKET